MDTASYLLELAQKLAKASMSARELAALDFEADGRDISIRVRSTTLPYWYPPLGLVLGKIGNTCADRGVTVSQLHRITFTEKEVSVEVREPDTPAGTIFTFPIEVTVGLPAPTSARPRVDARSVVTRLERS